MTTHDSEEQVMSTEDTAQAYVPFDLMHDFMVCLLYTSDAADEL